MAYRFELAETIPDGLQRIASEEIDQARADLDEPDERGLVDSVHDARKRCKKLRAVTRLVRPAIGALYRPTNEAFRDAARELSDVRDEQVLVETFDALVASVPDGMELPDLTRLRAELVNRFDEASTELVSDPARLERAGELLEAGRVLVGSWEVDDDFGDLAGGFAKTYGRAVKRHRACLDSPTTERLHEWRKRVKYHWYHVRLFQNSAPELAEPWADRLHDLSDLLGDDHDIAVLLEMIETDPERFGTTGARDAVRVLGEGRRVDLQERAFALGARLTVEAPDAVIDRLHHWWDAWHAFGAAPERTELADFAEDDDLSEMSTSRLRDLASAAGLPGRSRMRRDELEAALRARGA